MQRFITLVIATASIASAALAPLHVSDAPEELIVKNHYLVKLKDDVSVASHQEQLGNLMASHADAQLKHTYDFDGFRGYAVHLPTGESLDALRAHPEIEYIEPDHIAEAVAVQYSPPWNLARIAQRALPLTTEYVYHDRAGEGVTVYILDTGLRTTHAEFEGRSVFGASFSSDSTPGDPHGHGTHVAGTVASRTFGVAKRARLVGVRVLDQSGRGPWSGVIAGLQWAVRQARAKRVPAVINGPKSSAVNTAINNAVKAGIHVVVAAGNSGVNACLESPASATRATTVGSSSSSDGVSWFSNHGPCVDIFAPGEDVLSTFIQSDTSTAWMSGTSMAAPHVAGIKALMLAQGAYRPDELQAVLRETGTWNVLIRPPRKSINLLAYSNPPTNVLSDYDFDEEDEMTVVGDDIPIGGIGYTSKYHPDVDLDAAADAEEEHPKFLYQSE